MRALFIISLLALSFTTGFTCSKHSPEAPQAAAPPAQEQMAAPAPGTEAAPAPGAPAEPPPPAH